MGTTIDKIGRVSSASVEKHTDKGWDEWVEILDKKGARKLKHSEITAFLKKRYRLSLWWCEAVAIGFEMHAGLRVEGRNQKGEYTVTITKSMAAAAKTVWKYLASPEGLAEWLGAEQPFKLEPGQIYESSYGAYGQVRTRRAATRVRMTWQESDWSRPSVLELMVLPRPKDKCLIVVMCSGLSSNELRERMRGHWRKVLERLAKRWSPPFG